MSSQIPPGTDLSTIPVGMPPPGVTSNFHNPPSLTPTLIGLNVFLIGWGTTFATLRIWLNRKKLNIGDAFVIVAVVLAIAYCSILLSFAQYFRHSWDLPLSWYTATYVKQLYAQGMLLGPTIFFSKEAIFLLYLDIFHVKRAMRLAIVAGMLFTAVVYWTGLIIESIFCAPHVGESWDPLVGGSRCNRSVYWGIVQGACAVVIDIWIFVLPIPVVSQLQLDTRRKIQILAVFMTALMGILASVFAEVYRARLLVVSDDQAWSQAQQLICVIVENWVAVIVSCMPAFATFCRLHVSGSRLFVSLQSRFWSWTSHFSSTASKGQLAEQEASNGGSHRSSKPRGSTTTTGPYYRLEERAAASSADSSTAHGVQSSSLV